MSYKLTVGLEIHAQLRTETKMFCNSKNDPDEKRPNVNICPVCMGYPGSLPVINKEAARAVLRVGMAVGGDIADYTEFDRKNYFYPDIPKGYQISQYKYPLVRGGEIAGIALTRIHLEEDTGKNIHIGGDDKHSLVDFNRAGIPLMELVTEPVMHSPEEAGNFARELQLLLQCLGVSEANMEKGEMRVEANISVSHSSLFGHKLGTKVEVKNLNSFKAVEKAIKFEYDRQVSILEKGEKVVQETRGWDEDGESTFLQREKEESHDYRYFPDPDLPKLFISEIAEFSDAQLRESLPELPWQKRKKYEREYGLRSDDAELYVRDREKGRYLEEVYEKLEDKSLIQTASNYLASDLKSLIPVESFAELVAMVRAGEVSSRGAKDIISILEKEGGSPKAIAEEKGLMQKSNPEELKKVAEKIIEENKKVADDYKGGKESSMQFLVGQAMKETKGSGNPQVLKNIFEELLK
jgi:aspartyl-tRNA(Asn)/glutamyl-tRNA(Gln) amidotransferase subunit B